MINSANFSASNHFNSSINSSSVSKNSQNSGLTLTITADKENVSTGDKSENSVNISVKTPNNELEFSVNRKQAVNQIEKNSLQRSVKNALGVGNQSSGTIKKAIIGKTIIESDSGNGELQSSLVDLTEAKFKFNSAQFALNQFSNSQSSNNQYASNQTNTKNSNGVESFSNTVSSATSFYIKSSIIFSTVDRVGQKLDVNS